MSKYEFTFFTEDEQEAIAKSNKEQFNDSDQEQNNEFNNEPIIESNKERTLKVRLDKWLWAARFYKTRALARAAVENQKVVYIPRALDDDEVKNEKVSFDNEVTKPSREIEKGAVIRIRFGDFEREVTVVGLSTRRHSTEKAEELYTETAESKRLKEHASNLWHAQQSAFQQLNKNEATKKTGGYLRRSTIRQKEVIDPQTNYNPNYATQDFET